ncbi:MAG: beta-propeller domain-containing protein [Methanomassiliicoccales archaeon]
MERFVDQASQRGNALNNLPTSWTSQASGDVSHSTTNIQVEGVDEADCVKTDGTYLFIASADAVSIVRAYPPEAMQNVSKIDLKGALGLNSSSYVWIDGIYLHEDRLMVVAGISEPNYYSNGSILSPMIWRVPEDETLVCLFSLSDMQQPLLLGTFGISGYSITSRMIGGFLYSVTQQSIWTQMGLARPTTFGPNGTTDLPATSIRFDPQSTDPSSFINVMAVDVIGLKCESTSLLAGYASTIYTSQDAMYLTFLKYSAIPMYNSLSAGGETTSMAQASVEEYNTTIYKLSIDALSVKPAAQGDVPGYMLNQFSMDEKDGRLRVATSSGWMDQQSSSVFILDQHLNVTGELRNIAPGERIYSVRFVDDSLYLVTFRQVDPLFVINLGNPTSPIILGQLNVSGFSSYLQPLDQDHLVGIGMQNGSLKLSLFNVTQSSSPREVGTVVVPGWSNSQAMWDHKAVLFDAQTGTLAIPITSYDQGGNYSSSIMVFDVNSTHIAVRGKVLAGQMEYLMRAQFIGNFLYSISDTTIRVNLISDLSQVNEFVYQERAPSYFPFLLSGGEVVAVGAMR